MPEDIGRTPPGKQTIEAFRNLLQVEVRSLIGRVSELTVTVGDLFSEVNGVAIQLEESVAKMQRLSGGLEYCRKEIVVIKKSLGKFEGDIEDIRDRIIRAEKRMQTIQEKLPDSEGVL